MDTRKYVTDTYGKVEDVHLGVWPHGYFMPGPIPRNLHVDSATQHSIDDAQFALSTLAGMSRMLPVPEVILAASFTAEALSSSRIEGTQASLSDVISADLDPGVIRSDDVRDIVNYKAALSEGVKLLGALPLTQRLFCEVHRVLMTGVRGSEKTPGELRRSPVWVGGFGAGPDEAAYIPPLPERIPELLTDWENFVNAGGARPSQTVVRLALAHYQFETIHPFLDGNGRVGRVLIVLMMMSEGVFSRPVLGMSSYFDRHRSEYYARFQAVREVGDMAGWIRFFAGAVHHEATLQASRIQALVTLRERYLQEAAGLRATMSALVNVLVESPVVSVAGVKNALGVSQPTAAKLLHDAKNLGWLVSLGKSGKGGRQRWYAKDFWDITTDESPG